MLKAAYISYDGILCPPGESQILPYLEELSKKGIRFFLISFEKKEYYNKVSYGNVSKKLSQHGIKWLPLPYHKRPQVLSTLFDILNGLMALLSVVLKYRPRVIHARSYVAALIAWSLKKIFCVKFIFDMRGFWAEERIEGKIWRPKSRLYRLVKILERRFLKDANEIIVLTDRAKSILNDWGYNTAKVSVAPCCVDTGHFRFDNNRRVELRGKYGLNGKFIFVHTGSLEYWYMKEQMLDYFSASISLSANVHFLILSHDEHKKIKRLIVSKKLDEGYFTILKVPYSQIPGYLSAADAGIFFITPVFSKLASSPTKFAEYLSCGLPVIVNQKVGDLERYVLDNQVGDIVRGFSQDEYKRSFRKLMSLFQYPQLRHRCAQAAHNNFSLTIGSGIYHNAYLRLA